MENGKVKTKVREPPNLIGNHIFIHIYTNRADKGMLYGCSVICIMEIFGLKLKCLSKCTHQKLGNDLGMVRSA